MNMDETEICRLAIRTYGSRHQIRKAIEELAELACELCHLESGRDVTKHVAEEIADVQIVCRQMEMLVGEWRVAEWKKKKLKRLQRNVELKEKLQFP